MKFLIVLSILTSVCVAQNDGGNNTDLSGLVSFSLYTRGNTEPDILTVGNSQSLKQTRFVEQRPTFVIIHGWRSNVADLSVQGPKDALLGKYDCNVLAVDWSKLAILPYTRAVAEVPRVGAYIAETLKSLQSRVNLNLKTTSLIGHGLGAHVCGFAGKGLQGLGLARITGLDPSLEGFSLEDPATRLDAADADFVDCIYTNAGKLGFLNPICGANFYPNGGKIQRGCGKDIGGLCSHSRAYELYRESVSGESRFKATQCRKIPGRFGMGCVPSNAYMGEPADPSLKGIYHVRTKSEPPFGYN